MQTSAQAAVPTDERAVERTLQQAVKRFQSGELEQAYQLCSAILEDAPGEPRALHLLGAVHLRAGHLEPAISALRRAAALDPDNFEVHNNFATALRLDGRWDEGEAACRRAIAVNPACAGAHQSLGVILEAIGKQDAAIVSFEAAIDHQPSLLSARRALADLLRRNGRLEESLAQYAVLAGALPGDITIDNARAVALATAGRVEEAEALLRAVIAKAPDSAEAHTNLGNLLGERHAVAEAIERFRTASALDAHCADTRANLGHALRQAGRAEEAIGIYDQAQVLEPDNLEAGFGNAVAHLTLGRFEAGWAHYRVRESMADAPADLTREVLPADLSGKRVLIVPDQGLGDEIFFLRFAYRLRARGAQTTVRCDPRLVAMLGRAAIADRVLAPAEPAPDADYTISMGDLPHVLGLGGDGPPPPFAIPPGAEAVGAAADLLAAAGPPPYLGVTWRAGAQGQFRRLFKQAPIEGLAHALAAAPMTVISLQRGALPGETEAFAAALGRPVFDGGALNGDLETMLALIARLDAYVGVSNTNVHLRAAAGRTSHVLVPSPPEFRWMEDGRESPWFPGSPVYRQAGDGGWDGALRELAEALAAAGG